MSARRFDFQRSCVDDVLHGGATGLILNAGSEKDPAGLRSMSDRVINLDIEPHEGVDLVYDITLPWRDWADEVGPFALVVLGDILEHLTKEHIEFVLQQARRYSQKLCLTIPEETEDRLVPTTTVYPTYHQVIVTEGWLRSRLLMTNWEAMQFEVIDYDFVPRGYLVYAC